MVNLTPQLELEIREYLKTKVETVPAIGKVFTRPRTFSSEQDFIDECKYAVEDDIEIRYCEISLVSFRDSQTDDSILEDCDDMPIVFLTYNLNLHFEFKDERKKVVTNDDETETTVYSNSFDDFVKAILDLRNKFVENRYWEDQKLEHSPLVQIGNIITEDAVRHQANFQVIVTVL